MSILISKARYIPSSYVIGLSRITSEGAICIARTVSIPAVTIAISDVNIPIITAAPERSIGITTRRVSHGNCYVSCASIDKSTCCLRRNLSALFNENRRGVIFSCSFGGSGGWLIGVFVGHFHSLHKYLYSSGNSKAIWKRRRTIFWRFSEYILSKLKLVIRHLFYELYFWMGVVLDLAEFQRTGGGRSAQETPNITFSENEAAA